MSKAAILLLFFGIPKMVFSQDTLVLSTDTYLLPEMDSIAINFPFIKRDSNVIKNEKNLNLLFQKLEQNNGQVNILHIGDSHVQAGILTGTIRQELQKKFGNAGYGHFFPYAVAHTNGPIEIKSFSQGSWVSKRNSKYSSSPVKIGLSGHTLQTYSFTSNIKSKLPDSFKFDEVLVFHAQYKSSYKIKLQNVNIQKEYIPIANENSSTVSLFQLDSTLNEILLKPYKSKEEQSNFILYGLSCRNTKQKGILYHSIGVNGAEFRHYNNSDYFFEHTQKLNPDLIIISMGTNEAYNYAIFNKAIFYTQVDLFIKKIKEQNPSVDILFTMPGESYRKVGKIRENNPYLVEVREVLLNYCSENNFAYWDWYSIMGGADSMDMWAYSNLTDRYKIHYTVKGYRMQGYLFYNAFMDAYQKSIQK